jgi:hypothetical protein
MTNTSRCLSRAALYERRAEQEAGAEARRTLYRLASQWREIAAAAADFDHYPDPDAKARIYALVDAVAEERRAVA